jgi:radical SAM superfamily enzyme YgiQ (UPF0313 family)
MLQGGPSLSDALAQARTPSRRSAGMKILLVEPAKSQLSIGGEDAVLYEPLALEYVAAGVSKDHDVRMLDLRLERRLDAVLEAFRPDIVGITSYTVHVNTVRALFDRTRQWNPEVLTVVGGHHATVVPEDFLSASIDLIVIGEGVFAFKEIVARSEKREGFDGIPGVAFGRGGSLVRANAPAEVDLDAFPFPDRSLTKMYRRRYFSEWLKPLASIRTSKGCPHRCSFCALWKLTGGRYFRRQPERVVEELAGLDEECVFFADDESLVDSARMKTLAELIKDAGIRKRYFCYVRSDTIVKNPGLLEKWKEVGLERVFVGLESCKDEDLEFIRKGSTTGDNDQAVRILQDLGIEIYASFIVRPDSDRADFAGLRRYCRTMGLNFPTFAVLTPLPGTDFYDEVKEKLITRNYDYFDFIHTVLPTTLPLEEFYAQYHHLCSTAVPLRTALRSLRKYPLEEIPRSVRRYRHFLKRAKTAYLDYEDGAWSMQ